MSVHKLKRVCNRKFADKHANVRLLFVNDYFEGKHNEASGLYRRILIRLRIYIRPELKILIR